MGQFRHCKKNSDIPVSLVRETKMIKNDGIAPPYFMHIMCFSYVCAGKYGGGTGRPREKGGMLSTS